MINIRTITECYLSVSEAHPKILHRHLGQLLQGRPEIRGHLPCKPFLACHHIARARYHIARIHAVRGISQDHHFRLLLDFRHPQKFRLTQGEENQAHDNEP